MWLQVLLGKTRCTERVDIYSYGVVLWEICSGTAPEGRKLRSLHVPEECPESVADLVAACLSEDPQLRPSARQLVERLSSIREHNSGAPKQQQPLPSSAQELTSAPEGSVLAETSNVANEQQAPQHGFPPAHIPRRKAVQSPCVAGEQQEGVAPSHLASPVMPSLYVNPGQQTQDASFQFARPIMVSPYASPEQQNQHGQHRQTMPSPCADPAQQNQGAPFGQHRIVMQSPYANLEQQNQAPPRQQLQVIQSPCTDVEQHAQPPKVRCPLDLPRDSC